MIFKKQIEYFKGKLGDDYFDRMLKTLREKRIGQDYLLEFVQNILDYNSQNNLLQKKTLIFRIWMWFWMENC